MMKVRTYVVASNYVYTYVHTIMLIRSLSTYVYSYIVAMQNNKTSYSYAIIKILCMHIATVLCDWISACTQMKSVAHDYSYTQESVSLLYYVN